MNKLKEIITKDGSVSLSSQFYKESFHSHLGALSEAQSKFINPCCINRFKGKSVKVLDICFGLGYNSALIFKEISQHSSFLKWYGLEIDKRPLEFALNNDLFRDLWDPKVLEILSSLLRNDYYKDELNKCKLIWGDARTKISNIPEDLTFDLIFLDGFSPQNCPEIWTVEFLSHVVKKLNPKGRLITYSSAAAIRKTLIDLQLRIFNIKPHKDIQKKWSNGTVAITKQNKIGIDDNPHIENLSLMQKEHLWTKSSIPYRDPHGDDSSEEILKRRKEEQLISNLNETNLWRKKWILS